MIDTALLERESKGQPVRVGMVGAGAEGRAIALQLGSPVPGIRLVGISNRTLEHGEKAFSQASATFVAVPFEKKIHDIMTRFLL